MGSEPCPQAVPAELLVFGHTVDSLFNSVLERRMTPQLRAQLQRSGLDLSRPVLPAYPLHLFETFLELTARELYPHVPLDNALCFLGEAQVDAFARTLLGRATFSLMRLVGVRRALAQLTVSWRNANNFVQTRLEARSPRTFELWVNEVGRQPQSIQGILSRALQLISPQACRVSVLHYDGRSCTYLVELAEDWGPTRASR